MQAEFQGKVFIVTGGARGLGRGFAEAILKVIKTRLQEQNTNA